MENRDIVSCSYNLDGGFLVLFLSFPSPLKSHTSVWIYNVASTSVVFLVVLRGFFVVFLFLFFFLKLPLREQIIVERTV